MSARDLVKRAMTHGAQWRYLLLFVVGLLLPAALAYLPLASYFEWLFDHSPRSPELVARLDSPALIEALRQLGEPAGAAIGPGMHAALIVSMFLAPALAGASVALARQQGPLRVRDLLAGAGQLYPRMLRMMAVACVPLGVAAGGAALAFHLAGKSAEHAVLESTADRAKMIATIVSVLLVWLAHATVEAGRAHFAAQPERKSALLAWWAGARLTTRHPLKVLGLCLLTTVLGVGGALLVTALRYRIVAGGLGTITLTFLLAQLAVATIAWGRSSRLVGLVELIRAEGG